MKRLMTSQKTGMYPVVDILATCCVSSKRNTARCQNRQLEKYKRCLKLRYPNMEEAGRCDDPNAIHRWNIFKSEVIEKPNY